MQTSDGSLLDGRLRYGQPTAGYRTGLEPVLLAAAVPALAGQRVIEAGTGAGAGLLCLLWRVPGVLASGIERAPELAALARRNLLANGQDDAAIIEGDILQITPAMLGGLADHAMANPPWHDAHSSRSPDTMRDGAKRASGTLLGAWTAALGRLLRDRGTLTLILPAGRLTATARALHEAGFGAVALFPLWPRQGREARLMLMQGTKRARGADAIRPGLVLHDEAGFTAAAQAVLRDGQALRW